jgi:hypothetical protein
MPTEIRTLPPDELGPAWTPAPAAPGEKVYDGSGLRTLPAPPDASPKIGRAQAIGIAHTRAATDARTKPPDAQLRLLTDGDWSPGATGAQRHHDHRLVWVVTYLDVPSRGPGGPARADSGPTQSAPTPPTVSRAAVVMVDAATGEVLEDFSRPANDL